jgi:hypothetical protein
MTTFGWDASHYDGNLTTGNLQGALVEGISFFTHKVAEGIGDTEGTHDDTALQAARNAGIPFVGAYFVPRTLDSKAQVDRWWDLLNVSEPWWRDGLSFSQIDLERWSYDNVSAAKGIDCAKRWRDKTGKPVLLYASHGQYGDELRGWDGPLWNAHYVSRSAGQFRAMYPGDNWQPTFGPGIVGGWAPYSGKAPSILQYTSDATIAGLTTCDANAFRGSVTDFAAMLGSQYTPPTQGGLLVDGVLGRNTISRWQQIMHTPVDGVIDAIPGHSSLVSAVQRHLNSVINAGLAVDGQGIVQDGKSYKTVAALQRYLGTSQDGRLSTPVSECVKAVQRRLNTNTF